MVRDDYVTTGSFMNGDFPRQPAGHAGVWQNKRNIALQHELRQTDQSARRL
jgi:hypothetical protein